MIILGIETSCDETALALIEARGTFVMSEKSQESTFECRIIASLIHSQAELHSPYGGVFPTLAKREHEKHLQPLLDKILKDSGCDPSSIDAIAVTEGPGLEPALWTGITFAESLAKSWNKPVIPVNHMEGHVVGSLLTSDVADANWHRLRPLPTPALALLISGGHTELVSVTEGFHYSIIGQTKDDAVGEAFDKSARLLGLPYPGGPHLSHWAAEARAQGVLAPVGLPRPMLTSKDLNFSFSGLKTAVLYAVRDAQNTHSFTDSFKRGLAREFEDAVADSLDAKIRSALDETGAQCLIIGGGVSANTTLRERFTTTASEFGIPLYLPSTHISGDNALMIALAGALTGIAKDITLIKAHGTKRLGTQI